MTDFHHRPEGEAARTPRVSVIVPAHDAEQVLPACLDALSQSDWPAHELIVVDDGSTDRTAEIARARGATVVATPLRSGPGAARNLGVEAASGEIVLFIDSDVVVRPDTITRVASHFNGEAIAAVFGSYDDAPSVPDFFSQYKNLQHHYVHQTSHRDVSTFWAGCGAIRRSVFLEVGGFDTVRFARPSIEDIELGYRVRERGHRIVLDRELLVKHLKRWTLRGLILTDLLDRALPWSALILERGGAPRDLNVRNSERHAAALVWASLGFIVLSVVDLRFLVGAVLTFVGLLLVNRGFYGFLARRRGWLFAARAIPLHGLYYLYSSIAFVGTWVRQKWRSSRL